MRSIFRGSVCWVGLCVLGCGGEAKPPPKTPAPPAAEIAEAPVEPAVDLSPVPAPRDLVLTGHLARPLHVADTLGRWAGLPLGIRQLLPGEVKWADELIAWDAPVQVAGAVIPGGAAPDFDVVVSVGLTSLDRTVAALREQGLGVQRLSPGVYQVSPTDEEAHCAVAASRGTAPARLVCGPDFGAVERLLPFAARGLPDLPRSDQDLELVFNPEPLQRLYAQQISSLKLLSGFAIREVALDHPGFDRALADAVYALADELQLLANDVERVSLQGKLDEAGSNLVLGMTLKLKADKTWLAQTLEDAAQRSGPAPEVFWQLPEASSSASYTYPIDPARLRPLLRTAADLADGYLDHEKVSRASRDRVRNALLDLAGTLAPFVQAEGSVTPAKTKDKSPADLFAELLGWSLLVVDGPAEPQLKLLKDLHALLNDRELRKFAARKLDVEIKEMPTSQMKPFTGKGVPAGGNVFVVTIPGALLDEHPSWIKDIGITRDQKAKSGALKAAVAIVPDGKRSIMVIAADEKVAAERVAAFKAGKEPKLAQRGELASLRTTKAFSAGFFSLEALSSEFASLLDSRGRDRTQLMDALPHHARVPMLNRVTIDPAGGVTTRVEIVVPRAVFEDVAALAPALGSF